MSTGADDRTAHGAPKRRFARWGIARHIVQACALVVFLIPVIAAGWSLLGMTPGFEERADTPRELPAYGSFASSSLFGIDLLDPLSYLQTLAASRTFVPGAAAAALVVVVAYALVRGRSFCGWVCPLGTVLEAVGWIAGRIRRALGLDPQDTATPLPRRAKIITAGVVIVLSALAGFPVFEAVSPLSAVHRLMLFGSTAGVVTFVLAVVLDVLWGKRSWCRCLCPLGGLYEAIGRVGLANVRIDHGACVRCNQCKDACPADPAILEPVIDGREKRVRAGDCMACGACVDACPSRALSLRLGR